MESKGANTSTFPSRMPHWQISSVRTKALVGSPLLEDTAKGAKNGMIPSFAMAWSKRGAPVRDCKPAPRVDKKEPISITHWLGQAMFATTSFPPMEEPNLKTHFW